MKRTIIITAAIATGSAIAFYFLRKIRHKAPEQEITQRVKSHHLTNVFARAKSNMGQYLPSGCRLTNFVRQVRIKDGFRRNTLLPNLNHSPNQLLEAKELSSRIYDNLHELSPKTQEVFLLIRKKGIMYEQIAAFLRISVKTVEHPISRSLSL